MNINLHIERLILEGLPATNMQSDVVGAALEGELGRLLMAGGLAAPVSRAAPRLPPGHINVAPGASSSRLGEQIGGAVYHVLNQSERQITSRRNSL
jgi:hypothetical protein